MCLSAILGIGAAVAKGVSSKKASDKQADAADDQLDLQESIYKQQRRDTKDYRKAGKASTAAYLYEMGMGSKPKGYKGFQASDSFNNILETGVETIEGGAANRGNLFSGATATGLEKYRYGLASNEVNNYLNRLAAGSQQGLSASLGTSAAGTNFAEMGSTSLANAGDAGAAGTIGIGNAITSGFNTGLGTYGYMQNLDEGNNPFANLWGNQP